MPAENMTFLVAVSGLVQSAVAREGSRERGWDGDGTGNAGARDEHQVGGAQSGEDGRHRLAPEINPVGTEGRHLKIKWSIQSD